jgi:hypothetical protein
MESLGIGSPPIGGVLVAEGREGSGGQVGETLLQMPGAVKRGEGPLVRSIPSPFPGEVGLAVSQDVTAMRRRWLGLLTLRWVRGVALGPERTRLNGKVTVTSVPWPGALLMASSAP